MSRGRARSRLRGASPPPFGTLTAAQAAALATLEAAPGADAFFDSSYGYAIDASNKVSLLASRIGVHTVEQSSAPLQPVWGAHSPTGRHGITFDSTASQALVDPLTTLGALYAATQAFSSLVVVSYATLAGRVACSFGFSGSSTHLISNRHVATTGADRRGRTGTGGTTTTDGAGAGVHVAGVPAVVTDVFSGSAYSSWVGGTLAINAGANTRSCTVDQFMVGCVRSNGSYSSHLNGTVWGVILSRSQWNTSERQALEAAAKVYWGLSAP